MSHDSVHPFHRGERDRKSERWKNHQIITYRKDAYSNLIKSSNKKISEKRRDTQLFFGFFLSPCFLLIKMDKTNSNHKSTALLAGGDERREP